MAQKYAVGLNLGSGDEGNKNDSGSNTEFISPKKAGLIPRSVRLEIAANGVLPDAPSKELVEAAILFTTFAII